jgi:hypothetical protein
MAAAGTSQNFSAKNASSRVVVSKCIVSALPTRRRIRTLGFIYTMNIVLHTMSALITGPDRRSVRDPGGTVASHAAFTFH